MADLKKLKVTELKEMLTERGLSTTGKKDELVARLEEAIGGDEADANAETAAPAPAPSSTPAPAPDSAPVSEPEPAASTLGLAPAPDPSADAPPKVSPAVAVGETKTTAALSDFDAAKAKRAERFGIPVVTKSLLTAVAPSKKSGAGVVLSAEEAEKIKKRTERFGIISPAAVALDPVEAEKVKKRAERFGSAAPKALDSEEEDRRKKRAARFNNGSTQLGTC